MIRTRLRQLARVAGRFPLPKTAADVCAIGGIAAITGGVALIYLPAGLIALGLLLVVEAVGLELIAARKATR